MLWPSTAEARGAVWGEVEAWPGGPSCADPYLALLPAIRSLFLLGYRVVSVNLTETTGSNQSVEWISLDVASLTVPLQMLPFDRPRETLNIAFDLEEFADDTLDAEAGYGMPPPLAAIGCDEELPADGLVPDELLQSIDAFVDEALTALGATWPAGKMPIRDASTGLVWVFDPYNWRGMDAEALGVMTELIEFMEGRRTDFLREQVTGERAGQQALPPDERLPADLAWLMGLAANATKKMTTFQPGRFTGGLGRSLQARGQSEILTHGHRWALFWSNRVPCWLDVLAELLARGAILIDGLVEPCEPVTA